MRFKLWLEHQIVEPGSIPIPSNYIRLYHYTDDLESVSKNGIDLSKAKGHTYGEPNVVWASAQKPGDNKSYVEFAVSVDDPRIVIGKPSQSPEEYMNYGHNCAFNDSIKPNEIIAVHEPWHNKYRYIMDRPELQADIKDGKYDHLINNKEYGPAINLVKNQ